jgi:hypothetical protein
VELKFIEVIRDAFSVIPAQTGGNPEGFKSWIPDRASFSLKAEPSFSELPACPE